MTVIHLAGVSKQYRLYHNPMDRLREVLTGRPRHHDIYALRPIDLEVSHGEVVGVVGNNGAGKSTLLKLVTGTLAPSSGTVAVNGRVSALLELGAGFHPEVSGRENVYLSGALAGLSRAAMDRLFPGIVEFSGIGEFIDQPVKTYSSGMFMRLAFAVATAVEPDILIVDEALSVGDGAFARKSFDRIMAFRRAGKTILFCSHSLYQVEAICDRVIWLEHGAVVADGEPGRVIAAYSGSLEGAASQAPVPGVTRKPSHEGRVAAISRVEVSVDGARGRDLAVRSGVSELTVRVAFSSDPALPTPTVGFGLKTEDGRAVTSAGTLSDGVEVTRDAQGNGEATVVYPHLPLLKGRYSIEAYLLCEEAIHLYDYVIGAAHLEVTQEGLEQGMVILPHHWS
ncbi:ABC transporter ATP-binding protein [Endothiovibrio diazotrophicus]